MECNSLYGMPHPSYFPTCAQQTVTSQDDKQEQLNDIKETLKRLEQKMEDFSVVQDTLVQVLENLDNTRYNNLTNSIRQIRQELYNRTTDVIPLTDE